MVLEFYLAASQVCLIGPDFAKAAPNLGRLLRREAAVFVKFDWLVRHIRPALPGSHHPDFKIGRTRQPRNNTKSPYFGSPQVCSSVSLYPRLSAFEPKKSRISMHSMWYRRA